MNLYDDNEALAYIKRRIAPTVLEDKDIHTIVDALYDYYDDNGLLDLDLDEDVEDINDDIDFGQVAYILSEELDYPQQIIHKVITAENQYQESLLNPLDE